MTAEEELNSVSFQTNFACAHKKLKNEQGVFIAWNGARCEQGTGGTTSIILNFI
jgi:hypothetical protein